MVTVYRTVLPQGYILAFGMAEESCRQCVALREDKTSQLHYCWMSGEFLLDWKTRFGAQCPLKRESED